ncbi:hypothetical protein RO3G_09626 [Rhizopus delemar RA 99-880]|uniref:Uncharacterized protein n=1 Tax=Rhizopus delemar (strain RA 99-880 / ATCC MYA-4621 / FGSC 9543 / NRRL 43880) TaxID=246409 RepID=I1C8Y6_RHIO9|nr:hypothetical protein RO3G_09626 [Rhizopus delemar RA 99-880]|eukprot:EIE84916.1 hypothetical protein RO3G_09626 [Rhizopus delemar RA 99-880]
MSVPIEKASKTETNESLADSCLAHSLQSNEPEAMEIASWKMKAFVLLCILSLPVYANQQYSIWHSYVFCHTCQVIYGLGGGMIVTMQEGIVSRWFRDKEVAIIVGILLCVARLTKWAAKMVAYPITNASGSHVTPIYVATMLCALGVLINFVYWIVMWQKGWVTMTGKELVHKQKRREYKKPFQWSYSTLFYIPGIFWMVPLVQLVMSSVLSSFDDVATEYVEFRYKTTSIMAGYQSSLTQVVPVVLAPIMGIVVHKYGQRLTIRKLATFCLINTTIVKLIIIICSVYSFDCAISGNDIAKLYMGDSSYRHDCLFTCFSTWSCFTLKLHIFTITT